MKYKLTTLRFFLMFFAFSTVTISCAAVAAERQQKDPTESEIRHLLEIRSAGKSMSYAVGCTLPYLDSKWREIKGLLEQGNQVMASAAGSLAATDGAVCASLSPKYIAEQKKRYPDIADLDLPSWAEIVGRSLSVFARVEGDSIASDHAMQMLMYAKKNARDVDSLISFLKGDAASNSSSGKPPSLKGTAVSIVSSLVDNGYAFEQDYLGKMIEATGKITYINGGDGSVRIGLLGNTTKSDRDLSLRDVLVCTISNKDELIRVRKLKVGGSATVQGKYEKGIIGEIDLTGCQVK
jgi:hypothetical protein